ncbi:ATP-grasp domain-containing protein, partial [Vibrio cholerae]|nr:ATP-grasp domain-containing protein [Vibrio cholerae]
SNVRIIEEISYEEIEEKYLEIDQSKKIDLIYSFSEDCLLHTAELVSRFNVKGISLESLKILINKESLRNKLIDSKFSIPFKELSQLDELHNFYNKHGEIILKPKVGSGSEGVIKVSDEVSFNKARSYISSNPNDFIVEKYIKGQEFSIETMSKNGKHEIVAITEKTLCKNSFAELQHVIPALSLSEDNLKELNKFAIDLLTYLDYQTGPNHIEVKLNEGEIFLIEINNRVGGDYIAYLINSVTGRNLYQETIDSYFGFDENKLDHVIHPYRYCVSRAIYSVLNEENILDMAKYGEIIEYSYKETENNQKSDLVVNCDKLGMFVFGCDDKEKFQDFIKNVSLVMDH